MGLPTNGNTADITVDDVLQATFKGLRRGLKDFETKVYLIMCCIRGKNGAWLNESVC